MNRASREMHLGVNVDHVATVRQARGTRYPDPVAAALLAEQAGAHLITVHLREDRRHIQERDVRILLDVLNVRLNLEMAISPEILELACAWKPSDACLVPERREELTTEGGLDVVSRPDEVRDAVERLELAGVRTALFIDPDPAQVRAAAEAGARVVELHTGRFADAATEPETREELRRIAEAATLGAELGLEIHAGHGLTYHNAGRIAALPEVVELNIGHAIVARAILTGMEAAVRDMKALLDAAVRS